MEKVTVITVCYNASATIRRTIESILCQTYKEFEYLIIDGKSTDDTFNIVNEYQTEFEEQGIIYRIVSEKDNGIYDAMNKGIKLATGDWIIFMNADDSFYDENVLQEVFGVNNVKEYGVVYGDCIRNDGSGNYYMQANAADTLPKQMPFMHQAVFARRNLCLKYPFELKYKLCADYNMFFHIYAEGQKFLQIDKIICNYSIRGISGKALLDAQTEVIEIKKCFQNQYPISRGDRLDWQKEKIKMRIKMLMPEKIMQELRRKKHLG